eukprot:COSAG01_NODE_6871_length_3463_cov_17.354637_6_plen_194_part_00
MRSSAGGPQSSPRIPTVFSGLATYAEAGNCWYAALVEAGIPGRTGVTHTQLRTNTMQYLVDHPEQFITYVPDDSWDTVVKDGAQEGTFATQLEIVASAEAQAIYLKIHTEDVVKPRRTSMSERAAAAQRGDHRPTVHIPTPQLALLVSSQRPRPRRRRTAQPQGGQVPSDRPLLGVTPIPKPIQRSGMQAKTS